MLHTELNPEQAALFQNLLANYHGQRALGYPRPAGASGAYEDSDGEFRAKCKAAFAEHVSPEGMVTIRYPQRWTRGEEVPDLLADFVFQIVD